MLIPPGWLFSILLCAASVSPRDVLVLAGRGVRLIPLQELGGFALFTLPRLQALPAPRRRKTDPAGSAGGNNKPKGAELGRERSGESQPRARSAPRRSRPDFTRFLPLPPFSFPALLRFYFFSLLFFLLHSPPLFPPSLPGVVGSVFWYFLPPPPPSSCPASARRGALSGRPGERSGAPRVSPSRPTRVPTPRVSHPRRVPAMRRRRRGAPC